MEYLDENKIRLLVIQTLRQMGIMPSPLNHRPNPSVDGPKALIVFNGGLRLADKALEQVQRIQKLCRKTAFFTAEAARSVLCKDDIKGKAGGRCILDTVSQEGVEKVLTVSDVLVLPTFCFTVAAKAANLVVDDFESQLVFTALVRGKKVLATRDSFSFLDFIENERIENEVERILKKLEDIGLIICDTENLEKTFKDLMSLKNEKKQDNESHESKDGATLITGRMVTEAFEKGLQRIRLAKDGKITPLARDLAKEYSIEIVSETETR